MPSGDQLLERLSQVVPIPAKLDRLELLLNDYLACLVDGNTPNTHSLADDGVIGFGAYLALQSSSKDRDDVDWSLGSHLGSVIWSTIFALALKNPELRENAVSAALSGYRTGASVTTFFGVFHRSKWHVTATAGSVAAASAASVMLGLSPSVHQNALRLAISNTGGSGKAPREREGAAGFNRAAATTLGIVAALSDARSIDELWDGPGGLLELYSITGGEVIVVDGLSTSGIRPFPTNGFSQSAVLATARLSARSKGQLHSIEVHIAKGVAPLLDGSRGGTWWDIRFAVACAWKSSDPTVLIAAPDIEKLVKVVPTDVPIGGAIVIVNTSMGDDKIIQLSPPGITLELPEERAWAEAKWAAMAGTKVTEIAAMSREFIVGSTNQPMWQFLESLRLAAC
jgi:hypothetical protein